MKHLFLVCAALLGVAGACLPAHAESPQSSPTPLATDAQRIVLQPIRLQASEEATLKPGGLARLTYEREPSKSASLRFDNCKTTPRSLPRDVMFDLKLLPDHVLPCFGTDTEQFPPLIREVSVHELGGTLLGVEVAPSLREQGHEYRLAKFEFAGALCDAHACVSDTIAAWVDCSGQYEASTVTPLAVLRYEQPDKDPKQRCGLIARGTLTDDPTRTLSRLRSGVIVDADVNPVHTMPALPLPQGGWVRNVEAGFNPGCSLSSLRTIIVPGTELGLNDKQGYALIAYPARETKSVCSLFVRASTQDRNAVSECFPAKGAFNGHYLFDAQGMVRFEARDLPANKRFQLAFQDGRLIDLYDLRSVELTADHRRTDVRIWQAQAAALWPQEVAPLDDASAYACYLKIGEKARERAQRQLDAQAQRGAP